MAPFVRLAQRLSSYSSTIAFNPSITPFVATFRALRNHYWLAAAVATVSLSGEALNIVISGVPYSPGQMYSEYLVSAYMSLAILGWMILVFVVVLICRGQERRIPVPPYTLAAKMSYLVGSRLCDDVGGSEWHQGQDRNERARISRKKYSLQQRTSPDGGWYSVIDAEGRELL